mgnify:CR=1 FL=1
MAGFSIIILAILGIISLIGLGLSIAGLVLLIIFLVKRKRKSKAKNILKILGIVFLVIGIPMTCVLPGLLTIGNNAAINSSINPKQYPVTNAIAHHDNNKLKDLLENGANPNEIYSDMPAIFSASDPDGRANSKAVKLLINYHAAINAAYPIYNFSNSGNYYSTLMQYIFISPIATGNENELLKIIDILLQNGYDANQTDNYGNTLLMFAASTSTYVTSHDDCNFATNSAKLLINHGASINATDEYGRTPLMWACGSGDTDDSANQDLKPTIKFKDSGFAPFDYRVIKYLIDNGADINAKDINGYTALDYFKQSKESAKTWSNYDTVGKSQAYIEECKKIENILQSK